MNEYLVCPEKRNWFLVRGGSISEVEENNELLLGLEANDVAFVIVPLSGIEEPALVMTDEPMDEKEAKQVYSLYLDRAFYERPLRAKLLMRLWAAEQRDRDGGMEKILRGEKA